MKIHRLEIEGFGPFRDRQVVDFDAFADDGIFLIAGKTGAGKSSVLDAICFALYGGVPRYIDGDKRLRSDHSALDEPTRVVLDFSTGGRRLRVERVPSYERLKKSGHGTTVSAAQARLDEWIDGEWRGVAARAVDVGHELGPILGLTQQQFLQVILLAQGKFAQFLHASNDERQALLRTLFDSHRFSDYEKLLDDRRREVEALLERESRDAGWPARGRAVAPARGRLRLPRRFFSARTARDGPLRQPARGSLGRAGRRGRRDRPSLPHGSRCRACRRGERGSLPGAARPGSNGP